MNYSIKATDTNIKIFVQSAVIVDTVEAVVGGL